MARRKRCWFCHKLFYPDPRVGRRQWCCSEPACQARRPQESQRRWRHKHPEDGAARRLRRDLSQAKSSGKAPVPRPPPRGVPWEEMRDEIPPQLLVILGFLLRFAFRAGQDERSGQVPDIAGHYFDFAEGHGKDETARRVAGGYSTAGDRNGPAP